MSDDLPLSRRSMLQVGMATGLGSALAGCSDDGTSNETTESKSKLPGSLVAEPSEGHVGDTLVLSGRSLPAEKRLDVVWFSMDGRWAMANHVDVIRPYYESIEKHVGTVQTDAQGLFTREWEFPEDYGGKHAVEVRQDDEPLARTITRIRPSFTIDRQRAPLGTFFEVTAHGLGIGDYTSLYEVAWDNGTFGIITGVSTNGTASTVIPAAGPPGKHVLRVGRGWTGVLYLNLHQSPYEPPDFPTWVVEVTEPAELPPAWTGDVGNQTNQERLQTLRRSQYPEVPFPQKKASLSVSPVVGSVGDTIEFTGDRFRRGADVKLEWYTKRGNRVEETGFGTHVEELATVRADNGRFQVQVTLPDDLGGLHPVIASVNGDPVATTTVVTRPSIVGIEPESGTVGTEFSIHLKGVGWTAYDNTYALCYDNQFLGYACGFNSQGDVEIPLTAAGHQGYHTIDLYPVIYQAVRDPTYPDFYHKPQLSYGDDHPGRPQPAHHAIFRVTDG